MLASVYFIYVYIRGLQLGIYLVQMSRTYYLISCCENGCPMPLWVLAIKTAAFRLMWNTVNRNTLSLAVETLPNVPRKATGKDCTCLHDARYDNRCILKHNNWTFVSMCTGGCWKQTVALFWKKKNWRNRTASFTAEDRGIADLLTMIWIVGPKRTYPAWKFRHTRLSRVYFISRFERKCKK